jgi:hypothetical protein
MDSSTLVIFSLGTPFLPKISEISTIFATFDRKNNLWIGTSVKRGDETGIS